MATSGGMDSTALLHYLQSRAAEWGIFLCAVHCEHGIRGEESVEDMRFVQTLCKEWNIPLYVFQEDCLQKAEREKTSVETAARNFRYACFEKIIQEGKADCIATAHHMQDEAETVLFRIARGTSLSGAAGMYTEREGIIRPFLDWSKEGIIEYVRTHNLSYREDKTNTDTAYTRNKLRHEVLPLLEETVAGAIGNLARFAMLAAEDDAYLYRQSERLIKRSDGEITVLFSDEKPLFTRACLIAMKALGIEKDYTRTHLEGAFALQKSERGAYVTLPKNIVAKKTEYGLAFSLFEGKETSPLPAEKPFSFAGFDGGMYEVRISDTLPKTTGYIGKILRLDADILPQNSFFRFRREGDEIERFGGGRKTLKKYYNEEKIPVETRVCLPIIASAEEKEVYVVCGYEISEKVKVTEKTKRVAYITLWKKA